MRRKYKQFLLKNDTKTFGKESKMETREGISGLSLCDEWQFSHVDKVKKEKKEFMYP